MEKSKKFDTQTLFMNEVGKQFVHQYKDAIWSAYLKVYANAENTDDTYPKEASEAEILDDLVAIMYEVKDYDEVDS